jgi:hypothetical protein
MTLPVSLRYPFEVKKSSSQIILVILVCLSLTFPQQQATGEVCPAYDFQSLFFEDYYPGKKWDNRSGNKNITWSARALMINDEPVTRSFTPEELTWIRSAFQSWDDALDTLKFSEMSQSAQAEVVIGYVALTSADNQPGANGYWDAWWKGNWRYRATIKIKASNSDFLRVKDQFIHTVQHELGNVLGLGDIVPSSEFTSTQEDGLQPPFGAIPLSQFDTGMIRQLYGESTCPSTFLTAKKKAAAELKAKQEAEAKANATKKVTITCIKGKLIKKITATKPLCPAGFKKK